MKVDLNVELDVELDSEFDCEFNVEPIVGLNAEFHVELDV